ncbi:MAG: DivIVA domain-containing protein [Tractidigestivibacter sp.]|uniref:DivIVA domain-containing protein n=1 Tax=Tractidigestivibacter sp. TaxID=2847320 RepID=UPI003D936C44
MAITPADIEQQTFSPSKHGYDTEEVDAFLEQLSSEVDAMLQKIADLKGRLNNSEQQLAAAQAQVANLQEQVSNAASYENVEVTPAPAPAPVAQSDSMIPTEHQISQVLIVAQQSADKMVADARDNAEQIRSEAEQKAREVIRQALAEKQNELDEIDRLKQSREDFRSEYKKLLQHFMDDADAVFPQQTLSSSLNGSGSMASSSSSSVNVSAQQPKVASPTPNGSASDFGDLD